MNDEQIQKILDDEYDASREDGLRSMLGDFYNRRMLSTVIFVWVFGVLFMAGAIYSAITFFKSDEAKPQIMYAAIFICCLQCVSMIKVFAWQIIHKNGLKREIKRLEVRIAELSQAVKNRQA
jgi:hypothetical protein